MKIQIFAECYRNGGERSALFCAVALMIEKMRVNRQINVLNTLRQIRLRRKSSVPNQVGMTPIEGLNSTLFASLFIPLVQVLFILTVYFFHDDIIFFCLCKLFCQ